MKNYKSLEAHNFVTSGLVFPPRVKHIPGDRVIVLGKVHHSQRLTLEPLKAWILAETNGNIIVAHCNCMAGRGETCSHVAAIIYLLEFAAKEEASLTCTDRLSRWLPPTMAAVPHKEIRNINFTSAKTRLKRLEAMIEVDNLQTPKRVRRQSLPSMTNEQWSQGFLAALAESNPTVVGLSLHDEHCFPFETPVSGPLDYTKLFNPSTLDLSYSELVEVCRKKMDELKITPGEAAKIEAKTRMQAHSTLWKLYRLGRITGSMISKVWQGNINNPAKSTWEVICKGKSGSEEQQQRKAYNKDLQRGKLKEETARVEYTATLQKVHSKFSVSLSGLVLHPQLPYIGSSPDARVSCDCCPGFGCLEIKCPREDNLTKCLDDSGQLDKKHAYYFQVQTHILVTGAAYCDLYLWLDRNDPENPLKNLELKPVVVRVYPDEKFQETMVAKCKDYFLYVILPEMVGHWFSRAQTGHQPLSQRNINSVLPNICFCQNPRRDPMVVCAGLNCTFKEFHCRCVDLRAAPRTKWYCQQCKPSAPKRRRRAVTISDENVMC